MTIALIAHDAKKEIIAILSNNSDVENAPREFSIIAEFSLGISKLDQIIKPDIEISSSDYQKLLECANQRLNHTPLSYITQKREFFGLDFYVSENTLIPRPDTETLVEEALNELKNIPCPDVLDLCTGTGAIGIAIKTKLCKAVKRNRIKRIIRAMIWIKIITIIIITAIRNDLLLLLVIIFFITVYQGKHKNNVPVATIPL